jgi:penicillin-insensitive murein endopeptidase
MSPDGSRAFMSIVACTLLFSSGCMGIFANDGTSISVGSHSRGALLRGVALPFAGTGYEVPPDWRPRNHRYATEEVAFWLTAVFREVAASSPGIVVHLGDISSRRGGDVAMHRSHASGRDVDIFFLASDDAGRPLRDQPAMIHFDSEGRASRWSVGRVGRAIQQTVPRARFDARRNWAVVRAMLSTRGAEVQWIFVDQALTELMLAEAEREGTAPELLARAQALLHQPTDSQPHDDHMHVRLFCDPADRPFGCNDKGPKRWLKKHWKYLHNAQTPRS